ALEIAERMAAWAAAFSQPLSDEDWQKVLLTEQGGMMESAYNLYGITDDAKYRDLALRFYHKKIMDPLAAGDDILAGNHANTNIPKVIGAARGYELTGDERLKAISENFYRFVTEHHVYCTGGTSDGELWRTPDAISKQLGPDAEECCCSYNMMKLGRHLYGQNPDAKFFDYYERLLYNVRYGTQDRNGMLMYYVSMKPGEYKTFGTPLDSFWCCTGTGSEEYTKLNDSIYWHNDKTVFVNLYIPSRLEWKERGLKLRMETKFPAEERVTLTVEAAPEGMTAIALRVPYWATPEVAVAVNGEASNPGAATPSSYLTLERAWKEGDVIALDLPLTLHIDTTPDDKNVQAAMYGPLVLAARMGDEGLTTRMIYAGPGPQWGDNGYAMPVVDLRPIEKPNGTVADQEAGQNPSQEGVWFERVEGSREYPLMFRTKGRGPVHTLVPLNRIMDERYSVYMKVETA
ncbi:MAG TPA: beta-L-arabinofuranosidase domain-containing protein, partial [Terracidiphilus sp.]|nr:beta-L-arabinofuranosidase domain-containing protein [Terracidiphilus sp.]